MNGTFHEKLPDDPAGSKHVANVHNTNDNTITLVIYYEFVDSCIIILYD